MIKFTLMIICLQFATCNMIPMGIDKIGTWNKNMTELRALVKENQAMVKEHQRKFEIIENKPPTPPPNCQMDIWIQFAKMWKKRVFFEKSFLVKPVVILSLVYGGTLAGTWQYGFWPSEITVTGFKLDGYDISTLPNYEYVYIAYMACSK